MVGYPSDSLAYTTVQYMLDCVSASDTTVQQCSLLLL